MLFGWQNLTPAENELIMRGVRDGEVYGGPFHLLLFPTDRCNHNCFFCYTHSAREAAAELDWHLLRNTLARSLDTGLKSISFGGGGEPFLYRRAHELLDFIEKHNLEISNITSNGTTITPRLARSFVKSRLRNALISLNETTPETHARMNGASPQLFERAVEGIRHLVAAKAEASSNCEIAVQVFIWKENYRRLPEMLDYIFGLGADAVEVSTIDGLPESDRMDERSRDEFKELLIAALDKWADKLMLILGHEKLADFGYVEQATRAPHRTMPPDMVQGFERVEYCYIGWYSATIAATGMVYPCCLFHMDESRSLGNLHENTIDEIWHGERMRRFRGEMRHMLLTKADPRLLPRKACFINKQCMDRGNCIFNLYLAHPDVYLALDNWAAGGSRAAYTLRQKLRVNALNLARRAKRSLVPKK